MISSAFQSADDNLVLLVDQIDRIHAVIQHHVVRSRMVHMRQNIDVYPEQLVRLVVGDVHLLLHCVCETVVIVYRHPYFAFVSATVHIAVDDKRHIARLVHAQDLDIMPVVGVSLVEKLLGISVEAEQPRQLVVRDVVAVQLIRRHEREHIAAVALLKGDILRADAECDLVVGEKVRALIKYLIHISFIVQQVHPVRRIAHAVVFLYAIIAGVSSLARRHIIFHDKGARLRRQLLDRDGRRADSDRPQVSPCHLIETAVYRHLMKGGVVSLCI